MEQNRSNPTYDGFQYDTTSDEDEEIKRDDLPDTHKKDNNDKEEEEVEEERDTQARTVKLKSHYNT